MPRITARAEVFEIMDDFKYEGLDIGDAYDQIYDVIKSSYRTRTRSYKSRGNLSTKPKVKRKLSAWNKYVKANSTKPRFRLRSGKLNLKKMGVAFRKTPAGKKK